MAEPGDFFWKSSQYPKEHTIPLLCKLSEREEYSGMFIKLSSITMIPNPSKLACKQTNH